MCSDDGVGDGKILGEAARHDDVDRGLLCCHANLAGRHLAEELSGFESGGGQEGLDAFWCRRDDLGRPSVQPLAWYASWRSSSLRNAWGSAAKVVPVVVGDAVAMEGLRSERSHRSVGNTTKDDTGEGPCEDCPRGAEYPDDSPQAA